jgi:cytoskeletal protein CcmA (bactofilin family)
MSFPASPLPSRNLLRPLLTLSVVVIGLVVISAAPAHAFENKPLGNVVVERGQTEPEVSTPVGDVTVDGTVEGDVRSGVGDVVVNGDGEVGGGIRAGSGDVEVNGPVGGDIDAGFGDVHINSVVDGDVEVGRGDVDLGPGGFVRGGVHYGSGEFSGNREAVEGTIRAGAMGPDMDHGMDHDWGGFGILDIVGWLFAATLFVACSVLVAVIAPGPLSAAARKADESPAMSLLFGVASVPAVVVLCVVLAVSIIGIPLLLLLAPAYLALVFFGALVAAFFVGRRVVFATGRYRAGNAMAAVVGALILAVAYLIPVLGDIFLYGFALFGAGASVLALVSRRRSRTYPYYGYYGDRRDA